MAYFITFGPALLAAHPEIGVGLAAALFVVTPVAAIWFGIRYRRSRAA